MRGVVLEVPLPQTIGHGRGAHGHARVAGLGLLYGIDGQKANGIDASLIELGLLSHHILSFSICTMA
jgi:hypothetical protein